jgi:hypothetical protein
MRAKLKMASPEVALTRILEAMERELLGASDEEIIDAAMALGMDPAMKGSAAYMGLKYPSKPQLTDFFELDLCKEAQVEAERIASTTRRNPSARHDS